MASAQVDFVNKFLMEHNIKTLEDVKSLNEYREFQRKLIVRGVSTKNGIMTVIKRERELYNLVQRKIKESKIKRAPNLNRLRNTGKKVLGIGYLRINEFFKHLFEVFNVTPVELDDYIQFCTNNYLIDECSQFLSAMINTRHSFVPEIFVLAARFEFKKRRNTKKARQFFEMGFNQHKKCSVLIPNEVMLEIDHCDMSDICLQKYRNAIATFPNDINFALSLLFGSLTIFPQTVPKMSSVIANDMVELYKHDELLWHNLAQFELKGFTYNHQLNETERMYLHKKSSLDTVKSCMNIYEDVLSQTVLKVNKLKLTKLYLDAIIHLRKSEFMQQAPIEKYMNEKLEGAFRFAELQGAIDDTPKYYLYWANNSNDDDKLMILSRALDAMKENTELWTQVFSFLISKDKCFAIMNALQKAIGILGNEAFPLWTMVLNYHLTKNEDSVEQFYREGCFVDCDEMAIEIRLQYLEYCVLKHGIDDGRAVFEILKKQVPVSPKLYLKMIHFEKAQIIEPDDDKDNVRCLFIEVCSNFGTANTEIWAEFIRFEYEYGTPLTAKEIFEISISDLDASLIPEIVSKFEEIKSLFTFTLIDEDIMEQCLMEDTEEVQGASAM